MPDERRQDPAERLLGVGGPNDGAEPEDPMPPGMLPAIALHTQFEKYKKAGFTEWQALYLIGQILAASVAKS